MRSDFRLNSYVNHFILLVFEDSHELSCLSLLLHINHSLWFAIHVSKLWRYIHAAYQTKKKQQKTTPFSYLVSFLLQKHFWSKNMS